MSPEPIGRAAELEAIGRLLDGLEHDSGVLLIEGEPGIGKTSLLRAAVAAAAARGHRVLSCVGAAAEAELSYRSLGDLLAPIDDQLLATLPAPQHEALRRALLRAAPSARGVDGHAVAAGLSSTLAALAAEAPVLVAIDDAQWVDHSSARVFEFCSRRLPPGVGMLLARRSGESSWEPRPASLALPEEAYTRREVGPLSLAEIGQLLRERAGLGLSRATLERVHSAAGGNPFFALELARSLPDEPEAAAALPLPETLEAVVADRLAAVPGAEEALGAVAISANPSPALIADALGPEAASQLDRAERAGLVEMDRRISFTHPLLAGGAYARLPATQRRQLHAKLATAVPSLEERGRHLAFADSPDAVPALVEAATEVRERGAPCGAAELLMLALERGGDAALGVRAGIHQFEAGDPGVARELLEDAVEKLPAGPERARALMLLAEVRYKSDSFGAARELLIRAHEEAPGDDRLAAQIDLRLMFVCFNLASPDEGIPFARSALRLAEAVADRALIGQALAANAIVGYCAGNGIDEQALNRAIELEVDPATTPELSPRCIAAFLYTWSGQLARAREELAAARSGWSAEGLEQTLAWSSFLESWIECWAGNLPRALELADAARSRLSLLGTASGMALGEIAVAMAAAEAGEVARARTACAAAEELFTRAQWRASLPWVAIARGRLELSLGETEAAMGALEPFAAGGAAALPLEPTANGTTYAGDLAEALIATGRSAEAAPLVSALQERGETLDRPWARAIGGRCRGLLEAAAGAVGEAEAAIERALAEHARLPMPVEQGRTLLALGRVRRRRKKRAAAKEALAEAVEVFAAAGATLWAERAAEEIEALGLRHGPADELTPSELRVARLAASGLTNREVAAALVVSPKTVEAHLGRAYRKLGIRSRAELGALMGSEASG